MNKGGAIALGALGIGAAVLFLGQNAEAGSVQIPVAVAQWQGIAEEFAANVYTILDPEEILAIIWNESTGNPNASNPGDPSWGLMGVTPLIAQAYGGFSADDTSWRTDATKNIKAGAGFLADLKNKYVLQYPSEWMQAYNEGETAFAKGKRVSGYSNAFFAHLAALRA